MAVQSTTERGDTRRTHILDAARVCFLRDGFHATSMQDLLRKTGLSAGAFYRYFPSKESLVLAIAMTTLAEISSVLDAASTEGPPPLRDALRRVMHAMEQIDIRHGTPRIAVQLWGEAQRNPELSKVMTEAFSSVVDWFEGVVAAQQTHGNLPAASARNRARVLAGLVQGFMVQRALFGTRASDYCEGLTTGYDS
ncbi:MAG: TetR/AcrR family transcriptional regulator [Acidobacteriaceae bacterium]